MKVAIKFCGGCDPEYDRVEYWEEIRRAAGDTIQWVSLDSDNYDSVLLICGCSKTCPQNDMPQLERVVTLTDDSLKGEKVLQLLESRIRWKGPEVSEPSEKGVSPAWRSKPRKTTSKA